MTKHVLFIGPSPSKQNVSASIPFAGTKSAKVLMHWIHEMDLWQHKLYFYNISWKVNSKSFSFEDRNLLYMRLMNHMSKFNFKIIALGNIVSKELVISSKINHFKLPHPSGRNRQLNNKEFIKEQLRLCKEYIND